MMENTKKYNKHFFMVGIDYKKTFHGISHSWIIKCMKTYKISTVISFMQTSMNEWKTNLKLHHPNGMIEVPNVQIKSGILQGENLSSLLFVLTLDLFSRLLNKIETGFNTRKGAKMITLQLTTNYICTI